MGHGARFLALRYYASICLLVLASGCDSDESSAPVGPVGTDGGRQDSSATSESGSTTLSADDICNASLTREKTCQNDVKDQDFLLSCKGRVACMISTMDPVQIEAYWKCANNLKCEYNDDNCIAPDGEGVQERPEDGKAVDECLAKHTSCKTPQGTNAFVDDICGTLMLVKPEVRAKLSACIAKACDEIEPCIREVSTSYGCEED